MNTIEDADRNLADAKALFAKWTTAANALKLAGKVAAFDKYMTYIGEQQKVIDYWLDELAKIKAKR